MLRTWNLHTHTHTHEMCRFHLLIIIDKQEFASNVENLIYVYRKRLFQRPRICNVVGHTHTRSVWKRKKGFFFLPFLFYSFNFLHWCRCTTPLFLNTADRCDNFFFFFLTIFRTQNISRLLIAHYFFLGGTLIVRLG